MPVSHITEKTPLLQLLQSRAETVPEFVCSMTEQLIIDLMEAFRDDKGKFVAMDFGPEIADTMESMFPMLRRDAG